MCTSDGFSIVCASKEGLAEAFSKGGGVDGEIFARQGCLDGFQLLGKGNLPKRPQWTLSALFIERLAYGASSASAVLTLPLSKTRQHGVYSSASSRRPCSALGHEEGVFFNRT